MSMMIERAGLRIINLVCLLLAAACVTAQGTVNPSCSFYNGQCLYNIQLGHQGQCDSKTPTTPSTSDSERPCCKTLTAEVTDIKNDINLLKSKLAELTNQLNDTSNELTKAKTTINNTEAKRDALLETLKEKEKELNLTQTELARIINRAGSEIKSLRDELTNATKSVNLCQEALGVGLTNYTQNTGYDASGPVAMTYCGFEDKAMCGYKLLSGEVSYSLMHKSKSSLSGPPSEHSKATPGGTFLGLDVQTLGTYRNFRDRRTRVATVESPMFEPAKAYCLMFWYSMRGPDVKGLEIKLRVGGGTGYPVWSKTGDQKENWLLGRLELDDENTANPFKIDFIASTDVTYYHYNHLNKGGDIGLDDIYVYNTSCAAIPTCPPGSRKHVFNNVTSCYTFHATHMSWDDAYHTCRLEGPRSALVSIETQDEQDFLVGAIESDPVLKVVGKDGFYTSGMDRQTERSFMWTDTGTGRPVTLTSAWHQGQPNNVGGNQNCLLMQYPQDNYSWGDVQCSSKHAFICEVYY